MSHGFTSENTHERNRTSDTAFRKRLLYPLSYAGTIIAEMVLCIELRPDKTIIAYLLFSFNAL